MTVCLRALRRHSANHAIEVIVVDNGSADASLDYLRSLPWIRLIETANTRWPYNVFQAWDLGAREARGRYYMTMHSDVFVRSDRWLDPFLNGLNTYGVGQGGRVAAIGGWKLTDPSLLHALYEWQKHVVGTSFSALKSLFGRRRLIRFRRLRFPRDYCALYERSVLIDHDISFLPRIEGEAILQGEGGGYAVSQRLWDAGYSTRMIPLRTMAANMVHIAHGTSAFVSDRRRSREGAQRAVEDTRDALFAEPWVQELLAAEQYDR